MKLLFGRTISLQLRLFVAVLLSVVLIVGDRYTQGGTTIRTSLNTLVSPLIYLANLPYELFSIGAKNLHTREQLLTENEALKKKQLLQSEQLQQLSFLSRENDSYALYSVHRLNNQIVRLLHKFSLFIQTRIATKWLLTVVQRMA